MRHRLLAQINATHAQLTNLSLDGAQILTTSLWRADDRVRLVLTTSWGAVSCAARVAWVAPDASRRYDTPHFRVGLQLLDANRTALRQVLAALERL